MKHPLVDSLMRDIRKLLEASTLFSSLGTGGNQITLQTFYRARIACHFKQLNRHEAMENPKVEKMPSLVNSFSFDVINWKLLYIIHALWLLNSSQTVSGNK